MDREGFVDIPFILAIAHPVWIVTSLTIAVRLRGTGLGLILSRVYDFFSAITLRWNCRPFRDCAGHEALYLDLP